MKRIIARVSTKNIVLALASFFISAITALNYIGSDN